MTSCQWNRLLGMSFEVSERKSLSSRDETREIGTGYQQVFLLLLL